MVKRTGSVWSGLSEERSSLWRERSIPGECPEARTSLASVRTHNRAHRVGQVGRVLGARGPHLPHLPADIDA